MGAVPGMWQTIGLVWLVTIHAFHIACNQTYSYNIVILLLTACVTDQCSQFFLCSVATIQHVFNKICTSAKLCLLLLITHGQIRLTFGN